ncbi:MAG: FAD-dependent tricarballylate dehydrogenase TcuA [Elsteraceae bacterium]
MDTDVLVIGGGNAALCAAITAREAGRRVMILERAPKTYRGGNSRHTRNLRCMHDAPTNILTDAYTEDEFFTDLLRVTGGETNEPLARMAIRASSDCTAWMERRGARFQPPLGGTLHLGRTNAFFLGGGKALLNALYATAQKLGIEVHYDARVTNVVMQERAFKSAEVDFAGVNKTVTAGAVVIASGGFESNLAWLREAWGPAADNFLIRGTPYNEGDVLKNLLNQGAEKVGDPTQGHCVAIDARAPKFDGGISTRLDCVSLGVVVNRDGLRFYDEGEDFWPKRYAIWGRLVAQQPDQIGYSLIDQKAIGRFMPSVFPAIKADSVGELAAKLGLPVAQTVETVERFNAAVRPGTFDHAVLDDCRTEGLTPEKTHWAQRIDKPPFYGYPLRPGVTFTYLGLKVNERAQVTFGNGEPSRNLFAAGEVMAGNILGKGYVAGIGMTIGTVFGRIAGKEAAHAV